MRRGDSGLNLLLAIDKPSGMSSHDVVNRVRRALGERRVGHAGTLDPAATGVLVIGVGQATRLLGLLAGETKSYLATIAFGFETNTDDAEGEPTRTADVPQALQEAQYAQSMLDAMLGPQDQVPPAYSAISVDGKRAYARARAGQRVELPTRRIDILAAQLVGVLPTTDALCWECAFTVSKGTYVRAIARDLGCKASSAAHLRRLCRTAAGTVTLPSCVSLDEVFELGPGRIREAMLDPVRALGLPVRALSDREAREATSGHRLPLCMELAEGDKASLVHGDRLMGVWEARGGRLCSVANFPNGIEGVRR